MVVLQVSSAPCAQLHNHGVLLPECMRRFRRELEEEVVSTRLPLFYLGSWVEKQQWGIAVSPRDVGEHLEPMTHREKETQARQLWDIKLAMISRVPESSQRRENNPQTRSFDPERRDLTLHGLEKRPILLISR